MSKDTSGPAFPLPPLGDGNLPDWQGSGGISIRDYFAAKAMHQMLHGAVLPKQEDRDKWLPVIAVFSYQMADAMIAERDK